ncbi:hypothetical protein Y699_05140 [Aspergillus fumigatus Z5]|nr:hypothetical protein Y699_05140 [Aspergillus fumigatus Z5]
MSSKLSNIADLILKPQQQSYSDDIHDIGTLLVSFKEPGTFRRNPKSLLLEKDNVSEHCLWIQFSSRTAKPLAVSPHLLGAECPGTRSTRVDTRLCLLQWSALCIARKVETCGVATVCSNPVAAHSYMYLVEMAAFLRDEFQETKQQTVN